MPAGAAEASAAEEEAEMPALQEMPPAPLHAPSAAGTAQKEANSSRTRPALMGSGPGPSPQTGELAARAAAALDTVLGSWATLLAALALLLAILAGLVSH